jgi:hypothetical protein
MKLLCGLITAFFLLFTTPVWASCATDLLAMPVAALPAQSPALGCHAKTPSGPGSCEWPVTTLKDIPITPDRRLVLLDADHQTGSGSRQYLAVYACVANKPVIVLDQRYSNGVRVEQGDKNDIIVSSGHWAKDDPMCCPSSETRQVFVWDSSRQRYVLKQVTSSGKAKPMT